MTKRTTNDRKPFAVKFPLTKEQWEELSYDYMDGTYADRGISFRSYVKRRWKRVTGNV